MFRSPSFFFRSHLGLARVCGPLLLTLYVVRRVRGSQNSLDRCALWPGRPWTTSPSPWTAGTAASGCTLAAHRLGRVAHRRPTTGGTPPEPPAALRAAQLFEISQKPENRQGLGGGHGQPQAVAHPRHRRTRARNPSGWMTEAAGARCAKARQGAQPWGSGGASPLPRSALGAGRRPGGLSLFGPLGGA